MSDQHQLKHDTQIHAQSSSLCDVSKFISACLQIDGNTVDLKVLLPSLGIHESSDDIIDLLLFAYHDFANNFANKLHTIGIERALFICDELCAPIVVTKILNIGRRLDRIYEYAIINHTYDPNHMYNVYNKGYRPISYNELYIIFDATLFNIALSNDLYISNSTLRTELYDLNAIDSNYLKDITDMHISDPGESDLHLDKIMHLTNVDKLRVTHGILTDYKVTVRNIRDAYKQLAKQLKCINITNSYNIINDEHLALCINLRELYMNNNTYIDKCARQFAGSLRSIYASRSSMCDDGLLLCANLKILNAFYNNHITTCAPFAKSLVMLNASGDCGISDDGLKLCTRLKILCCMCNKKITTCVPFAKTLRLLDASISCGIKDDGLKLCTKLTFLDASHNNKITTCAPFANSLKIIFCNGCNIRNSDLQNCVKLYYALTWLVIEKFKNISIVRDALRITRFINKCKV